MYITCKILLLLAVVSFGFLAGIVEGLFDKLRKRRKFLHSMLINSGYFVPLLLLMDLPLIFPFNTRLILILATCIFTILVFAFTMLYRRRIVTFEEFLANLIVATIIWVCVAFVYTSAFNYALSLSKPQHLNRTMTHI